MKRSFTVGSPLEVRRSFTGSSMFSGISDIMNSETAHLVVDFKTPTITLMGNINQEKGQTIWQLKMKL